MLGHTKISTTMLYARVTQTKIGMDMNLLQDRLDNNKSAAGPKNCKVDFTPERLVKERARALLGIKYL